METLLQTHQKDYNWWDTKRIGTRHKDRHKGRKIANEHDRSGGNK